MTTKESKAGFHEAIITFSLKISTFQYVSIRFTTFNFSILFLFCLDFTTQIQ